jgi:hypothetical protein
MKSEILSNMAATRAAIQDMNPKREILDAMIDSEIKIENELI